MSLITLVRRKIPGPELGQREYGVYYIFAMRCFNFYKCVAVILLFEKTKHTEGDICVSVHKSNTCFVSFIIFNYIEYYYFCFEHHSHLLPLGEFNKTSRSHATVAVDMRYKQTENSCYITQNSTHNNKHMMRRGAVCCTSDS